MKRNFKFWENTYNSLSKISDDMNDGVKLYHERTMAKLNTTINLFNGLAPKNETTYKLIETKSNLLKRLFRT